MPKIKAKIRIEIRLKIGIKSKIRIKLGVKIGFILLTNLFSLLKLVNLDYINYNKIIFNVKP